MTDTDSVHFRPIADPGPLGLLAFGMTTVLLSFHNLGAYGLDSPVLSMGIFYGGLAQIVAGVFEFKRGNTFGATAFTSYGFFWLTFVAINTGAIPGSAHDGTSLGIYFAMWGLLTLFLFIGTLKSCVSLRVVFATLTVLFFTVAVKDLSGAADIAYAAGAVGLVCGLTAVYSGAGAVVNAQLGRTAMPL
ncbi:MAG: acetate uptake transporter [Candidatus Methanoplasma sp.]|jgi:succinate-acetate transporter protein|nr:acetate uptake transporter [Candidatus Methanoplasma sp.]